VSKQALGTDTYVLESVASHDLERVLNKGKKGYRVFQCLVIEGSYGSHYFKVIWERL
jgi:hypothetical protein